MDSKAGDVTLEELAGTEWSPEFERMMRNRMIMGAIRYGRLGAPGKAQYDRIGSIIERARRYRDTGNDELLVDIANLAQIEYVEGDHPGKHFCPDDDRAHVESI